MSEVDDIGQIAINVIDDVAVRDGQEAVLPPVRFMPFNVLCDQHDFPRCPECDDLLVSLDEIDQENSLIIFVSHCWWRNETNTTVTTRISNSSNTSIRNSACSPPTSVAVTVDSPSNDQFKLCIEGISLVQKKFAASLSECYLWIDYCCLNQDEFAPIELMTIGIPRIIAACDCVFTPLFENDSDCWCYPEIWTNKYEEYMSSSWRGDEFSYMNRSWCRVEMFINTEVPLSEASIFKRSKFSSSLLHHHVEGKRPHIVYGTKEQDEELPPLVLPPLASSYFESYHPMRGQLSNTADQEVIQKLVDYLCAVQSCAQAALCATTSPYANDSENRGDVYEGEFLNGIMHGKGIFRYANGNVYEGQFMDDKRHGHGVFRFANGDVYEGEFANGNFRGKGTFKFANGNVYEGQYMDGKWDGKGIFKFVSGNVYEGEFQNDERHGKGVFRYASGDYYEGDYANDKRTGKGTFRFANGNVYEGDFFADCIDGKGAFKYANGDEYVGDFRDNKKHGRGVFKSRKGKIQQGVWVAGVYSGTGSNAYCSVM
jgi:hypothetical protein